MKYVRRDIKSQATTTDRIAIVNNNCGLGDAIALRYLLRAVSDNRCCQIDLFVPEHCHTLLRDHPCIGRLMAPRLLKREQFSEVIDISGISERNPGNSRISLWAAKMGVDEVGLSPEITIDPLDMERVTKFLRSRNISFKRLALICPFGSLARKSISVESCNKISETLTRMGFFSGGPFRSSPWNYIRTNWAITS